MRNLTIISVKGTCVRLTDYNMLNKRPNSDTQPNINLHKFIFIFIYIKNLNKNLKPIKSTFHNKFFTLLLGTYYK
jgi:hypothetical protein